MHGTHSLTNEEKRVAAYCHTPGPTDASLVTPATPLGDLDLNWREQDLPQRERTKHVHRLHPYLGKFIPQLVEVFLRKYFRAGQTVYDPFCGCGTTLVEANVLHINSIGCDIAAFNCLLSRVKNAKYDLELMSEEVVDILRKVQQRTRPVLLGEHSAHNQPQRTDNEYLLSWFAPKAREELLVYRSLIPNYHCQELLQVILSRAARSARLTTHFDLDFPKQPQTEPYYCYKHSRICEPVKDAFKFLRRYSHQGIRRIEQYSKLRTTAKVTVLCADARTVSLPETIDGVITSPPYAGLIDYHQQHRYAYELLGLPINMESEIGAAFKGNSQAARGTYQKQMASVLNHTARHMHTGSRMIIIVRDRYNLYEDIAPQCGFDVEYVIRRHVNRRTGRRANEFFEEVLIWRKK